MKRNYAIGALLFATAVMTLGGCGQKSQQADTNMEATQKPQMEEKDATYGQIKQMTEDSITIEVGTRKQPQKDDAKTDDADSTQQKSPDSMLEMTGEELTVSITDETQIVRREMGGMGNKEMPSGEKPDGEVPSGAPDGEKPDGEAPSGAPDGEKPDGEAPSGAPGDGQGQPPQGAEEELELSDLKEGDMVSIEKDEDSATKIIVMSEREASEDEASEGEERSM